MLDLSQAERKKEGFITEFEKHFKPQAGVKASYKIILDGKLQPLWITVDQSELECEYRDGTDSVDVEISLSDNILNEIIVGRMTFQRAFMSGSMKMKGDFTTLRMLDQLFTFM
jgi:putative sterol carrier protein